MPFLKALVQREMPTATSKIELRLPIPFFNDDNRYSKYIKK